MKHTGTLLSALACAAILILTTITAVKADVPPPGPTPSTPVVHGPIVTSMIKPNDRCAEAKELTATSTGTGNNKVYEAKINTAWFTKGSNVDDWYMYTTHEACGTDYIKSLIVTVSSDKPQIEVELYDDCNNWPIDSSIWTTDTPTGVKSYQFSGLEKDVQAGAVPAAKTYYIHVNYLRPPDDGSGIKYSLDLIERCDEMIY